MANNTLTVAPRTVLGKKVAQMRRGGRTPGNIYGHKVESRAVEADTHQLLTLLRTSSRNALIDLSVDGEGAPRTVIVRGLQRNPVNGQLLHIDFYEVSMTEKMKAQVSVVLVGASPAVATYGGILLQPLESVEVEALPGDIPVHFELDVTSLTELEQGFHVRDLYVDTTKVQVLTDPEVVIARVATPRLAAEDEEPAAAEAAEGAEGEEGAAPAEGAGEGEAKPEGE